MRILLFQVRKGGDPMLHQEKACFWSKLEPVSEHFGLTLETHNIITGPDNYQDLWPNFDLIMVGGSGDFGCVDNTSPWFLTFCDQLKAIASSEKPLFCSCFGHQALATALGGEVATDRSRSELGTFEVTLTSEGKDDPLLGPNAPAFNAQFGHNDFVRRLPSGATNLAHTPNCAVQAYRLEGKLVWGTQFHPELSHEENQERASNYLEIYDPEMRSPEKLASLFRPSYKASELLPRFVTLAADQLGIGKPS